MLLYDATRVGLPTESQYRILSGAYIGLYIYEYIYRPSWSRYAYIGLHDVLRQTRVTYWLLIGRKFLKLGQVTD